jgi:hypothetical protein
MSGEAENYYVQIEESVVENSAMIFERKNGADVDNPYFNLLVELDEWHRLNYETVVLYNPFTTTLRCVVPELMNVTYH